MSITSCNPLDFLVRVIRKRGSAPLGHVTLTPRADGSLDLMVDYPASITTVDGPFAGPDGRSIYYAANGVYMHTPGDDDDQRPDEWRMISV